MVIHSIATRQMSTAVSCKYYDNKLRSYFVTSNRLTRFSSVHLPPILDETNTHRSGQTNQGPLVRFPKQNLHHAHQDIDSHFVSNIYEFF